jgi:hypothetical protein
MKLTSISLEVHNFLELGIRVLEHKILGKCRND